MTQNVGMHNPSMGGQMMQVGNVQQRMQMQQMNHEPKHAPENDETWSECSTWRPETNFATTARTATTTATTISTATTYAWRAYDEHESATTTATTISTATTYA